MEDYKKKYEQAILRMNKWVEGSEIIEPKEVAEFVFPELKESEDERIKKEIITYLDREITLSNFGGDIATFKEWIAWLEKQGEQKPAWSEEDYDEMGVIACHLDNMGNEAMANSLLCIRDKYNNVKPKQKYEWSKEDEYLYTWCMSAIQTRYNDGLFTMNEYKQTSLWLKSLKERMKGE